MNDKKLVIAWKTNKEYAHDDLTKMTEEQRKEYYKIVHEPYKNTKKHLEKIEEFFAHIGVREIRREPKYEEVLELTLDDIPEKLRAKIFK